MLFEIPFEKFLLKKALKERFHQRIKKSTALGTDGISSKQFSVILDSEIDLIQRKVKDMTYRFSRFNEKLILKDKSSPPRAVYIPTVRDRLVLHALNGYLVEAFSEDLKAYQKSVTENTIEIIGILEKEKFDTFIKLDVKNFFPSLDHEILLNKIKNKIQDKTALSLLKKALNRSNQGIAQGLSIASQLAAIYLNDLDKQLNNHTNFKYFRFVDDILILCNKSDAETIYLEIQQQMTELKLDLHATEIGGKSEYGSLETDTLEYLGFSFKGNKISVRESTVEKLRKKLREKIAEIYKNKGNKKLEPEDYRELNLKITGCLYNNKAYGWLFFFKNINDMELLYHLDWFVKKSFDDFGLIYDPKDIKSFVKSYFKINSLKPFKLDSNSYIPSFSNKKHSLERVSIDESNENLLELLLNENKKLILD